MLYNIQKMIQVTRGTHQPFMIRSLSPSPIYILMRSATSTSWYVVSVWYIGDMRSDLDLVFRWRQYIFGNIRLTESTRSSHIQDGRLWTHSHSHSHSILTRPLSIIPSRPTMPPQKTKQSNPDTTIDPDVSTSDATRSTTRGVDPKVVEHYELEERAETALLGYAIMDIMSRQVIFGQWNPRRLNPEEQRALVDSFNRNGLDRFKVEYAIPLVISKSAIDLSSLTSRSQIHSQKPDGSHLKPIVFTPDPPLQLFLAGGRHRHGALEEWVQSQTLQLSQLKTELKSLEKVVSESEDHKQSLIEDLNARIALYSNIVNTNGQWAIAVYDKGTSYANYRYHPCLYTSLSELVVRSDGDDSLAIHLSTNQRIHSYKETAEEGVLQTFKLMRSKKQDWRDCVLPKGVRSKSIAHKINSLLQQDYIWSFCDAVVTTHSTHFVHSDMFKISSLHGNFLSPYGGVSAPRRQILLSQSQSLMSSCHSSCRIFLSPWRNVLDCASTPRPGMKMTSTPTCAPFVFTTIRTTKTSLKRNVSRPRAF